MRKRKKEFPVNIGLAIWCALDDATSTYEEDEGPIPDDRKEAIQESLLYDCSDEYLIDFPLRSDLLEVLGITEDDFDSIPNYDDEYELETHLAEVLQKEENKLKVQELIEKLKAKYPDFSDDINDIVRHSGLF